MNNTLQMTMLFDFYGDILTDKQRKYFDLYYNDDLSLAEIAKKVGISRPGVHDIIKRAKKVLMKIEQKTGIIQKWLETRAVLEASYPNINDLHPAIIDYFQMEND